MIDSTFIEELDNRMQRPVALRVHGREVLLTPHQDGSYQCVELPVPASVPEALGLSTLGGFVDYITANRDGLQLDKCVVHVENETSVTLCGELLAPYAQRLVYARARCASVLGKTFTFGNYVDHETFLVALQALFLDAGHRAEILALLSSIKDGTVRQFDDDGVSQAVTAKAGVVRATNVAVPNPVTLRPFRTFREVDQPASPFVLRLRSGDPLPQAALFEADGGAWKLEAIKGVADFLSEKIGDKVAILA